MVQPDSVAAYLTEHRVMEQLQAAVNSACQAVARDPIAHIADCLEFGPPKGKPVGEWSAEEVEDVLKIFDRYDADRNGFIDASELQRLCGDLAIEASMVDADTMVKDGKIDRKEFFVWWLGCSLQEAATVFEKHSTSFAGLKSKAFKSWTEKEIADVMQIFEQYDTDKNGFIDATELEKLCKELAITGEMEDADTIVKDGKIDKKEFFVWWCGCTVEEAGIPFDTHSGQFAG